MIDIGADLQRAFDDGYEKGKADRPQGAWIVDILNYKSVCSLCGASETHFIYGTEMWYGLGKSRFCPYCGARMFAKDTNVPNKKGATNE